MGRADAEALDRAVARVVDTANCSGCGACTQLDAGLAMALDAEGYARPVRGTAAPAPVPGAAATFDRICPGRRVASPRPPGAEVHPTLGPVVSAWEAWASDPEIRHRGSSGGTLTALVAWLTENGEQASFTGARAAAAEPRRTVSVTITSRDEALASAGSRYAPVASVAAPGALAPGTGLVGKPCEVSAARALLDGAPATGSTPLLLSFFCAGTPSQHATDALVRELGVPDDAGLRDLWYRGRGWPGHFTAEAADGRTVRTTYDESWGRHLGKATQWRCKICPDGVGESSDVTAADFWHTDAKGYPVFTEGDGTSALLARTPRGHEVLQRAFAAGVLTGRALDLDALAGVQPLQVSRRSTLLGRLVGARLAGRPVPRYTGFGLARLALGDWRETARTAKGSFRRVQRARRGAVGAR
ncbi:Coenzyme F420 hydrogenase/dehydrogenase, beta subunit C-terminal domain [Microlunatus capsulatus]|uniref:Coenzyme F420 hydrogenase subunit beta n=1 Tax=Microlunatus capsulatus TaxID=99117 RepID=A0ABS4ZAD5_9ACTN|nr:Coenzyme F420 hydrogenase/dehydrogenase, beta subunit C-terminal domain [Microlunatus capsulatus]MBP2417720.1 coenzyme F420 hydrogenase subunit beta [Microlunatus capsulatus]